VVIAEPLLVPFFVAEEINDRVVAVVDPRIVFQLFSHSFARRSASAVGGGGTRFIQVRPAAQAKFAIHSFFCFEVFSFLASAA